MSRITLKTLSFLATASVCVVGFASAEASVHGRGGPSSHVSHASHARSAPRAFAQHSAHVSHGPSVHQAQVRHASAPRHIAHPTVNHPVFVQKAPITKGPVVVTKAPIKPPVVINKTVATNTNTNVNVNKNVNINKNININSNTNINKTVNTNVNRVAGISSSSTYVAVPRYREAYYAPLPALIPAASPVVPRPVARAAYVADGTYVGVAFLPTSTAADISNFLQAYSVSIVSGPTADGVYKIRLSDKPLPASRIQEVVDSMRSQTAIVQSVQG